MFTALLLYFSYTDIDDYVSHTCGNNGSCVDGVDHFPCNCTLGLTGDHCETGELTAELFCCCCLYLKCLHLRVIIHVTKLDVARNLKLNWECPNFKLVIRSTNGQKDKQTDTQIYRQTHRQTDRQTGR